MAVTVKRRPVEARRLATSSATSTLPATTIGGVIRAAAGPERRYVARPPHCRRRCHRPGARSGLAPRSARISAPPKAPAATCTTLPPADNPTLRPASAVTSRSYPTTASRQPPASRRASRRSPVAPPEVAPPAVELTAYRIDPVHDIGGDRRRVRGGGHQDAERAGASTRAALVKVEPTWMPV